MTEQATTGAPRRPGSLTATYRLQLNAQFTLRDARAIVPYLHSLGVSHVYASPVLMARPGSTHGYDVADPRRVNPELGGEEALRELAAALHERGMGLIVDIVPNHMGIGVSNPYWTDVLRHGRGSRWAHWFDIDWDAGPRKRGQGRKLVLPVLGAPLDEVLARGEISLDISEHEGVHLRYFDDSFPVDPATVPEALQLVQLDPNARESAVEFAAGDEGTARLRALIDAQHYHLAFWRAGSQEINYRRFFDINELAALRMGDPAVFLETHELILKLVAERVIDGLRIDHVDGLRDPLGYLLALREAVKVRRERGADAPLEVSHHLDPSRASQGRREDSPAPTEATRAHERPSTLPRTASGASADGEFPIFVEKILSPGEELRRDWPAEGTTGYEFLNDLEAVFIHHEGALAVERRYRQVRRLSSRTPPLMFEAVAREGKLAILRGPLAADMKRLARRLMPLLGADSSLTLAQVTSGLVQLLASLPVYRTYLDARTPLPYEQDREVIQQAVARAQEHVSARELEVVSAVARAFLAPLAPDDPQRAERLDFLLTLQQTSGPATAKGVEDTALYNYFPLLSRNEVGGEPDRPLHDAVAKLHQGNRERSAHWPQALLATNTHDTKRSADLRARLDVLSECPDVWSRHFARWRRLNGRHRAVVEGLLVPDTNTEWLIYQTLVGLWPAPVTGRRVDDAPSDAWLTEAAERVDAYVLKAAKEAKRYTSWTDPRPEYEQALSTFVRSILAPDPESVFLGDVSRLVSTISRAGLWTALSRLLLHATVPGTPDIYRGDELWTVSLVDPDNRREVDYARRRELLRDLEEVFPSSLPSLRMAERVRDLVRAPEDDRLKLYLTWRVLQARRANAALFRDGGYVALEASGERAAHCIAFARTEGSRSAIVVAPRLLQGLVRDRRGPTGATWGDTSISLGGVAVPSTGWKCALSGREARPAVDGTLRLAELMAELPMLLLLPA